MKYSVSAFSRFLLGLLAVFYVSIIVVEATHTHESLVEAVSSDGERNGPETTDCKICAYLAHYESEFVAIIPTTSFALNRTQADSTIMPEHIHGYQTNLADFINRGPPCSFV